MVFTKDNRNKIKLYFKQYKEHREDFIISEIFVNTCLFRDLTFLFIMMAREGFSTHWCLACKSGQAEWNKLYNN